jgi:hypothetical protein
VQVDGLVPIEVAAALAACIERLAQEGVPPIFAFAYDAFWALLRDAADLIGRELGRELGVLSDMWAWRIAPADEGGWAAHRDYSKKVVRETDGLPSRLNLWIALSDAPRDHACLSVLPLSRDSAYPHRLDRCDTEAGLALPVDAGTGLVWDANLLHWGGPANPRRATPRVSVAVTLERPERGGGPLDLGGRFTFRDRLDLIALQIVHYQHRVPGFPTALRDWAQILDGLNRKFKR